MSRPDPRPRCPHCHRALRTCVCALAQAVAHQVEVLILMHPMEVHEAKGTGHLLHLCLPHSRVMVGEEFDAAELEAALHGRWASRADADADADTDADSAPRHSLLLYPDTAEQDAALGLAAASPLPLPWPQRQSDFGWWSSTAPGAKAARCSISTLHCKPCRACPSKMWRTPATPSARHICQGSSPASRPQPRPWHSCTTGAQMGQPMQHCMKSSCSLWRSNCNCANAIRRPKGAPDVQPSNGFPAQRLLATCSGTSAALAGSVITRAGPLRSLLLRLRSAAPSSALRLSRVFFCTAIAPNRASAKAMA